MILIKYQSDGAATYRGAVMLTHIVLEHDTSRQISELTLSYVLNLVA